MSAPISPWDYFAKRESPDGRYVAIFDDATEIAMGGPLRGTLTVCEKDGSKPLIEFRDASASFVWSSDSKAIAVPRWTSARDQKLFLLWVPSGDVEESEDRFVVLQLETFSDYRLVGIDSPIHRPRKIDLRFHPANIQ